MLRALLRFLWTIPLFFIWPIQTLIRDPSWSQVRVVAIVWLLLPFFILLQLSHWLGFLLDEIFYPRYRQIKIQSPIFITGIPRSGTTHLQRVLADHQSCSSMALWECLLAPSITQRTCYHAIGRVIAGMTRALDRLTRSKGALKRQGAQARFTKLLSGFEHIHQLGLTEPEEDFLALLSVNACFLGVVLFPRQAWYWQLTRFDEALSESQRQTILAFYRRLVQKHLYYHDGPKQISGLRYLSKNPSFLPWLNSLRETFPQARFVLCYRPAASAVASQLSALRPAWQLMHGSTMSEDFVRRIVTMMGAFYAQLEAINPASSQSERVAGAAEAVAQDTLMVSLRDLMMNLEVTVRSVLSFAQISGDDEFVQSLPEVARQAGTYQSRHRYDLREFSIRWQDVEVFFPMRFRSETHRTGVLA